MESMNENLISECFERLEASVCEMNEWWTSCATECLAYRLPVLVDMSVPEQLPVKMLKGKKAATATSRAFGQFKFLKDQDARTAFRLPGIVFISSFDTSLAQEVNAIKSELQELICKYIPNKHMRLRFCNRIFPKYSMGQIYRHIVIPDAGISSISFTWSPRTVGTTRLSRDATYDLLGKNIEQETDLGNTKRVSALSIAQQQVGGLAQCTTVLRRRPVPPHPRANIKYSNGSSKMVHANLPFIVTDAPSDVNLVDLKNFDCNVRGPLRSDKLTLECLHDGLSLYVETQH